MEGKGGEVCFACQKETIIREKEVTKEILNFVQLSRLNQMFKQLLLTNYCCYSCFNFITLYSDINEKLKVFEDLKTDLLSLETV